MKTLKLVKNSKNFFDCDVDGSGRMVSLDSSTSAGRDSIADQRTVKALLSGKYTFENNYGAGLKAFIGSKALLLQAVDSINNLSTFFLKYASASKELAIRSINATVKDSKIYVSVTTALRVTRVFVFTKGDNNG